MYTGSSRIGKSWAFTFVTKARPNAAYLMSSSLTKGNMLLY